MSEDPLAYRLDAVALDRAREDALPEHMDYRDEGCDLFPSCLSCPLPRCRYDVPGGIRAIRNGVRDQAIRHCRDEQLPIDDIARRFDVSRRTVFRVLAASKTTDRHANVPQSSTHTNGATDA